MSDHVVAHGVAIPKIGLGTWRLRDEACAVAVQEALRAGYRHIDTAAVYENEAAVGEGLRAAGVAREEIFVTTKVPHTQIGAGDLQRSAEASLQRLGLRNVDLLLIHWPNPAIALQESIAALNDAKRLGLAKHIGVSNFPAGLLAEAWRYTREPLLVNQCEYHPQLDQSTMLRACRTHGTVFTSYCPIGRAAAFDEPRLVALAEKYRKTPAQIVLRWHVQQPQVIAIPKSANAGRIAENIAIFDFNLTDAEMADISALKRAAGRMISPAHAPRWDA
ncbi:aldo/keto reductase [Methylovirgula sp. 4M-Z18]|uniref:aldo/keto reductase n=1 Tax=Methylovirgula sp. 4M-Z18 TaxID=2293567 RepID=UPI000E2EB1D8|nr:aldo/keto reductase [Methylovirgula sp. 4M-Z18]RFB80817.1 aldo/keto reductase [Methylovirgula sp. 4M-Z18]